MDRSDIMDIAKIQYFLEAARLNNFTEAARKCHIAQTTMTKYISQLEKELGCRLFCREHRGVSLTAEGRRFYEGMKKNLSGIPGPARLAAAETAEGPLPGHCHAGIHRSPVAAPL